MPGAGCPQFVRWAAITEPSAGRNLSRFQRWAKSLGTVLTPAKRTEITVETSKVLIIRKRRSTRGWCEQCGREVDLIRLEEAEALADVMPLEGECAHADAWHMCEGPDGTPRVCIESVRDSM